VRLAARNAIQVVYAEIGTVGLRYYNPVTGRYLNRDPLGYSDGLNVYN
jgi:RHS repeat-associated protein